MLTLQVHQSNLIFQSEKIRWGQSIKSFEAQEKTLCGDILLTAAYVSYVGPFTQQYRQELVDCMWVPFLHWKVSSFLTLAAFGSIILKTSVVETAYTPGFFFFISLQSLLI